MLLEKTNVDTAIIVIAHNNAPFILHQIHMISTLCVDDFDIVIVDNSSENNHDVKSLIHGVDPLLTKRIVYQCFPIDPHGYSGIDTKNPSINHALACQAAWEHNKGDYSFVLFLDHDNFPIKKFSVKEMLSGFLMAGIIQGNQKKYLWMGCLAMNAICLKIHPVSFMVDSEYGLDTGGKLYTVIERLGLDRVRSFDQEYTNAKYADGSSAIQSDFIYNKTFFHFVNGSNWAKDEFKRHLHRLEHLIAIRNSAYVTNLLKEIQ
jgi:glycosyltransferase involved in cell wall biosynthesis